MVRCYGMSHGHECLLSEVVLVFPKDGNSRECCVWAFGKYLMNYAPEFLLSCNSFMMTILTKL